MAVQSDGKIVVVGEVDGGSTSYVDWGMARYLPDGTLDTSFGANGLVRTEFAESRWLTDVALAPDGRVLVSGSSNRLDMQFQLARFNPDGTLDTAFGSNGIVTNDLFPTSNPDYATQVKLQPDGKILLAGITGHGDGQNGEFAVFRYQGNGILDTSFSGDGIQTIYVGAYNVYMLEDLGLQADGRILLNGWVGNGGGANGTVIRLNADGTLDDTFGGSGTKGIYVGSSTQSYAMSLDEVGRIVLSGGTFTDNITGQDLMLARINSDGSFDTSFDGDGQGVLSLQPFPKAESIYAAAFQSTGNLLALLVSDGATRVARFSFAPQAFATLDVIDNDVAGITVTPTSGLTTSELGGTATFTVVLTSKPAANVTIGISSGDTSEGTVSPPTLTFTPSNWASPRTVTITGVDDAEVDGNVAYAVITAAATSADPNYNGLNPADVSAINQDNELPL